jgi:hypothetical protein
VDFTVWLEEIGGKCQKLTMSFEKPIVSDEVYAILGVKNPRLLSASEKLDQLEQMFLSTKTFKWKEVLGDEQLQSPLHSISDVDLRIELEGRGYLTQQIITS